MASNLGGCNVLVSFFVCSLDFVIFFASIDQSDYGLAPSLKYVPDVDDTLRS